MVIGNTLPAPSGFICCLSFKKKKRYHSFVYYSNLCPLVSHVPFLSSAGIQEQIERNSLWQTTMMNFTDFCDTLINSKYYKALILMWISLGGPVQNTFKALFCQGKKYSNQHFIQSRNYDLKCSFINYLINLEILFFSRKYLWEFRC